MKKIKIIKNYPTTRISEDLEAALTIAKRLDLSCQIN